jgi:vancomycin resistance protein VanJ
MRPKTCHFLRTTLWIYIGLIWIWFALRLAFFDRVWWLSLLNTYAFYFLIPSLIFLPIALSRHKQTTSKLATIGLTLPGLLCIWFWGYLMIPPQIKSRLILKSQTQSDQASSIKIRAMSFNILFKNKNYNSIVNTIRNANPDIIGLQETQPHHIAALQQALPEYPYIAIHPAPKFHNIALLSRYPIASRTASRVMTSSGLAS